MTFSIVARSADGESWGVAVASKFLGVGAAVPAARAGVGALATQSYANTSFKARGLSLLAAGSNAQQTLDQLLADDEGREQRQVGIVDRDGGTATYSGTGCHDWAGGVTGAGVAIQGNILASPEVVDAIQAAWQGTEDDAPLRHRLLEALRAGDAAGGDRRGRQSAALLVVRAGAGYAGFDDVAVDLRVDDHPTPVQELARLLDLHELYFVPPDPAELLPLTEPLSDEMDGLARDLGHSDFSAWVGCENFENRAWPDRVDPLVLQILRNQSRAS
ncbi:MAG: DUF1028 domain-containing protein [Nocardioidaceae bacterium]